MLTRKDRHFAAAQKHLERGYPERALGHLARVLETDPRDARTLLKMAEIEVRRGALLEARDIYLRTAEVYLTDGQPQKAATVYKSVLKIAPPGGDPRGTADVRERLAEVYRREGMLAEAARELELAAEELRAGGLGALVLPALRKMVAVHPDKVFARIKLAEMASELGAPEEAVNELREVASELTRQGRGDEQVRVTERLVFLCPTDFALARELVAIYIARGNARLALARLQGALKAEPRHPENVALLAQALAVLDPAKAISVWRELAELHDSADRKPERDEAVRAALALDPTDGATRELAARWGITTVSAITAVRPPKPPRASGRWEPTADLAAELEQVDFFIEQSLADDAAALLEELAHRFPGNRLVMERRRRLEGLADRAGETRLRAAADSDEPLGAIPSEGDAPWAEGGGEDFSLAEAAAGANAASSEADADAHADLGIAYKQMGRYDAAIAELKQLAGHGTRAVFALTMMGECLEAKGELGEAVARYKEALNLPQVTLAESFELYYLLGGAFERLGDAREALYFFENLAKRQPRFRDVEQRIAALRPRAVQRATGK